MVPDAVLWHHINSSLLCTLYMASIICPLYYSSVTHPLEAGCTFLMYWKETISYFFKICNRKSQKYECQCRNLLYLIENSILGLVSRRSPLPSSPLHLLICYLNIYSPILNINVDDVSIFN